MVPLPPLLLFQSLTPQCPTDVYFVIGGKLFFMFLDSVTDSGLFIVLTRVFDLVDEQFSVAKFILGSGYQTLCIVEMFSEGKEKEVQEKKEGGKEEAGGAEGSHEAEEEEK